MAELVRADSPPLVVVLWHNRLFPAPELYRRLFSGRRLAGLVSASGDGAWLSGLMRRMGVRPVRGSRTRRGSQAVRELLAANRAGCDVVITPDGSRGPMYDMKKGAALVAARSGAPVVLLSFRFGRALRVASWDRFYLPAPFSRIGVSVDRVAPETLRGMEADGVAALLKARMDAITVDTRYR